MHPYVCILAVLILPLVFTYNRGEIVPCHPINITCDPNYPYRSYDGSCNNLNTPWLGMTDTPFSRILPIKYKDGISLPCDGLPPVRKVRTTLFPDIYHEDHERTQFFMQWGQSLTHDIVLSLDNDRLDCCNKVGNIYDYDQQCLPLMIPSDDKFLSQFGVTCLNMVRHNNSVIRKCGSGPAQQISSTTGFLDSSDIYGAGARVAQDLRTFYKGKLNTSEIDGGEYLPTSNTGCTKAPGGFCFRSGDVRINQNPTLIAMTTLFYREHNNICEELSIINPHWSDETLYQESRKILAALRQLLTYEYWLPLMIGREYMEGRKMTIKKSGNTYYNPKVDPRIINSFATSSFRSPHSEVQGQVHLYSPNGVVEVINLSDHFNRPAITQNSKNYDNILFGMAAQKCRKFSRYMTKEMTDLAFKANRSFGTDISSVDMSRGRDHGLCSYTEALRHFFGHIITTFEQLITYIPEKFIPPLKELYTKVEDIDLYVAGLLERKIAGTIVGPTDLHIIGEQFYRIKNGDRFWFENHGQFTKDQLEQIRKYTGAHLICRGGHHIEQVFRNPFQTPSITNPLVNCSCLPRIDFSKWKDINQK